jgi:hypothetical protein
MKAAAAGLKADDTSLYAERMRGASMSHREWVACDG